MKIILASTPLGGLSLGPESPSDIHTHGQATTWNSNNRLELEMAPFFVGPQGIRGEKGDEGEAAIHIHSTTDW